MSRWGLGRRPRGRHALGAAVTEIPSAPVRVVTAPAPTTDRVAVAPAPTIDRVAVAPAPTTDRVAAVAEPVTDWTTAGPWPATPPVVLERDEPPPAAAVLGAVPEPRTSFETATLEPDFLASLHAELYGGHPEGVGLPQELPSAAPLWAPHAVAPAAPADPRLDPLDVTVAPAEAWSPVGAAPEADPDALTLSSTSWSPEGDQDWSPDPVPPSDAATPDLAGPPLEVLSDADRFASLLAAASDWPGSSARVVVPADPSVDVPAARLPDRSVDVPAARVADASVNVLRADPAPDPPADLPLDVPAGPSTDAVDETVLPDAPPLPLQVTGRVQLGFRDGTTALLDPDSEQAHALEELALMLTARH